VVACSAFSYAARRLPTKCRDSRPEAVPLHSNDHAGPEGSGPERESMGSGSRRRQDLALPQDEERAGKLAPSHQSTSHACPRARRLNGPPTALPTCSSVDVLSREAVT